MDRTESSPSDYLAAERTFLAWLRTGLALMGFGFVVARFGLFLQALRVGQPGLGLQSLGLSAWFGTALIVLGVIVNIASAWRHIRLVRELKRGESTFAHPSPLAVAIALILAALGLAMAIDLLSIRHPTQTSNEKAAGDLNDVESRQRPSNGIWSSISRTDGSKTANNARGQRSQTICPD